MNCLRYYKTVKNEHIYKRTDKIHNHRKKLSRNVAHIAKWRVLKNEQTTSNLPNKTKKEPPMTGSGIVKNKASNFVKIAKTIINNAEYWTTLRLPTCDSPSIDRHYTPQTQQRHVTMTVCHYVMTVTTCDSPGIDRNYTPRTHQRHVTMTVCHYVMTVTTCDSPGIDRNYTPRTHQRHVTMTVCHYVMTVTTCDSPGIDRHYTPQTQQQHVTMTVCHYVMTVTTCDSPGIDRHYTPQTHQQHVTMTVCHYVMKHINQQLTHLCETNDTDVNTGWRSTIARTHDTIQQRPNAFNKYSWTHQTHQTTSAVTNGQRK